MLCTRFNLNSVPKQDSPEEKDGRNSTYTVSIRIKKILGFCFVSKKEEKMQKAQLKFPPNNSPVAQKEPTTMP